MLRAAVTVALVAALTPAAPAAATLPGDNGAIALTLASDYPPPVPGECCVDNDSRVFAVDPDGAPTQAPIEIGATDEKYEATADWSPDGNRLVLAAYPYGVAYTDLYTVAANGRTSSASPTTSTTPGPHGRPTGRRSRSPAGSPTTAS